MVSFDIFWDRPCSFGIVQEYSDCLENFGTVTSEDACCSMRNVKLILVVSNHAYFVSYVCYRCLYFISCQIVSCIKNFGLTLFDFCCS